MDNFIEILKNWGIPKVIDVTEIQEEVYRVLCEGDKEYILKVRNYFEKIKTEYELLSHLLENGIKVPIPLKTIENNFFFNISKNNNYMKYSNGFTLEVQNPKSQRFSQ